MFTKLSNGLEIPVIHFGTYKLSGSVCYDSVKHAIECGYLGVDTATIYRNENIVGQAIKDVGKTVFVTTKLSPSELGYESAIAAYEASLQRLDMKIVDLLLIHWPGKAKMPPSSDEHRKHRIETWKAMEDLYRAGRVRAIGVSNFNIEHLEQLFEDGAEITPMVNQVELHLQLQQRPLAEYCLNHKILLQGYSPLGSAGAPVLNCVPRGVDNPLRYALHGARVLCGSLVVKSGTKERISANLEVLMSHEERDVRDVSDIAQLDEDKHYCWNPAIVNPKRLHPQPPVSAAVSLNS